MIESFPALAMLAALIGIIGLAVGAATASVGARFLLSDSHPPELRCRRVERIAALPVAVSLLAILVLALPAVLKLAGLIDDHCLAHGLHHPHFCLRHLPAFEAGPLVVLLIAAGAWPIAGLVRTARDQFRHARLANGIARLAPARRRLIVTDSETPGAFLLGILRPRIVLTTGLIRKLSPAERRAVVRHEIAHARAGDLARRLILGLMMSMQFPQTRRRLIRHWSQAAEERADDAVAASGKGLDLASALVRILREGAPARATDAYAMGANSADVVRRIQRLADRPPEQLASSLPESSLIVGLGLIALALASQHHALETFVGWLAK
ncbi:MAG TPA: M56 family metallopeptidase [Wenzhouxiangellaceae bacterium]|nr:M56 family metallopeptidase [Wenzhouxiangellaceae bacterium]